MAEGRLLFVGHGAERTGPPIGLLHLLRWIHANTDLEFGVLLLEGGALEEDYRALGPVWVLHESRPPRLSQLGQVLAGLGLSRLGERLRVAGLRRRLRGIGPLRTVYVNSAWCIRSLRYLPVDERTTVVSAVHELSVGLEYHLEDRERAVLLERTDRFLVVSGAVWRELVERHGVDPARISLHHEMIEVEGEPEPRSDHEAGEPHVVGASGLVRWRKGPDLFLQVAALVRRRRPDLDVRWTWIGGDPDDPDPAALRADRRAAGLEGVVELAGPTDRPVDAFRTLDVLLLTSREDAYPLVCLEAASVGVPVVCFATGGMPELVRGDVEHLGDPRSAPPPPGDEPCGVVVDYPDLEAMATAVIELVDDQERARRLGACGAARVRRHHAVEVAAPRLVHDLGPWLRGEAGARAEVTS